MPTTPARRAPCAATPTNGTAPTTACSSAVRTSSVLTESAQASRTPYTPIWWVRNIALRTLLVRQDWARTGILSERPDVSSGETKAARLARYAELRWSSDTSPQLELRGL